jgi:tRNA (cytidine/uridine-2'-O-)-methyltransferase
MVRPVIHIVLWEPEIAGNVGTLMRFAACCTVVVHIVEPMGFVWSDRHFRRAHMDYGDTAPCIRHPSWSHYLDSRRTHQDQGRTIATVPGAGSVYTQFAFQPHDALIVGRESVGLPPAIIDQCDHSVHIPMAAGARSLNMAIATAIVASEAIRQLTV